MSERSNLRLVVLGVLVHLAARHPAGSAVLPAGHLRRHLPGGRRQQHGPRGGDAGRARARPRPAGPPARRQPDLPGGLGRPDRARPGGRRAARRCSPGWPPRWGPDPGRMADRLQLCGTEGAKRPPVCWNGSPYQPIPVAKDVPPRPRCRSWSAARSTPGSRPSWRPCASTPSPTASTPPTSCGYIGPGDRGAAGRSRGIPPTATGCGATTWSAGPVWRPQYDAALRGIPGVTTLAVDQAGRVTGTLEEIASTPGNYVVTNIDAQLQAVVEDAARRARWIARATGLRRRLRRRRRHRRAQRPRPGDGVLPLVRPVGLGRRCHAQGVPRARRLQGAVGHARCRGPTPPAPRSRSSAPRPPARDGFNLDGYVRLPHQLPGGPADLPQLRVRRLRPISLARRWRSPATPCSTASPTTCGSTPADSGDGHVVAGPHRGDRPRRSGSGRYTGDRPARRAARPGRWPAVQAGQLGGS